MRFSASRLKTWQTCQAQAKFKYVDLLPGGPQNAKASFGTIVHKVLEDHANHRNLDRAVEQFKDLWQNPEKLGVEPQVWPKFTTYGGLKERGILVIQAYHDAMKWDEVEIVATEQEFVVPFGRHELHGFIDRLDIRRSGNGRKLLRVVDYKTNARKPNKSELYVDPQFTIYIYATLQPEFWEQVIDGAKWYEKSKDLNRRGIWFHLMDAIEIDAGPREDDDFMRLYRVCDAVEKAYEAQVFVPRIGEACELCPYTEPCGVRIPTREEVAAQEGAWI